MAGDTKERHPIDAGEVPHASGRASCEAEAKRPQAYPYAYRHLNSRGSSSPRKTGRVDAGRAH
jgi:hypothetical protein